jgi:hypothetical protein
VTPNHTASYIATALAAGTPAAPTDAEPGSGLLADPQVRADTRATEGAGVVGVMTASSDQRAHYAQTAAEAHPAFCAGYPAGCDGVHVSKPADLTAADKDGDLPVHVYAVVIDSTAGRDGARYVEVLFEFESGPVSVFLRTRDLADSLIDVADLLARSEPTWSWTAEQVEAYAAAMRDHPRTAKHVGGAR